MYTFVNLDSGKPLYKFLFENRLSILNKLEKDGYEVQAINDGKFYKIRPSYKVEFLPFTFAISFTPKYEG